MTKKQSLYFNLIIKSLLFGLFLGVVIGCLVFAPRVKAFVDPTGTPSEPAKCPKTVVLRIEIVMYILCLDWGGKEKIALAVAIAESDLNPNARNLNKGKSLDRGIFEINDLWHPEVTMQCAFDPKCNIDAANRIFREDGYSFGQWTAYRDGSYKKYLLTKPLP